MANARIGLQVVALKGLPLESARRLRPPNQLEVHRGPERVATAGRANARIGLQVVALKGLRLESARRLRPPNQLEVHRGPEAVVAHRWSGKRTPRATSCRPEGAPPGLIRKTGSGLALSKRVILPLFRTCFAVEFPERTQRPFGICSSIYLFERRFGFYAKRRRPRDCS